MWIELYDQALDDWRYKYSKLCIINDKLHVYIPRPDAEDVHCRRWRWWRPDDVVRYILHRSWEHTWR